MRQPTTDEILAACPEVIDKGDIRLNARNGRPKTGKAVANGWHSEKDRIRAATVYAVTGNASRTSELTGIPSGTIRQWKTQEWWPQVIDRIRAEHDDELDVKFTAIVDRTIEQIQDRIEKGDYIYDKKTGELIRKPMGGKELGVVTSIFVDKRELIRGKKKMQLDQQSIKDKLDQIAKALRLKEPITLDVESVRVTDEEQGEFVKDETNEHSSQTEDGESQTQETLQDSGVLN